jgi:uncharacterized protein (TIGR02145 family)
MYGQKNTGIAGDCGMTGFNRWGRALLAAAVAAVLAAGCSKKSGQEAAAESSDTSSVSETAGIYSASDGADTLSACEASDTVETSRVYDTFTDSRDSKKYKKVTIGNQTWMAENLAYAIVAEDGVCYDTYDNSSVNYCEKYGRLYHWDAAMAGALSSAAIPSGVRGVCPAGWHLPSRQEWDDLIKAAGGKKSVDEYGAVVWDGVGKKLKAVRGWGCGNGTDDYGFSALPAGMNAASELESSFIGVGSFSGWWTSTETESREAESGWDSKGAYRRTYSAYTETINNLRGDMNDDMIEPGDGYEKTNYLSIRCVQDDGGSGTTPTYTAAVLSVGVGASGGGNYAAGAKVIINAGIAPAGQQLKNWTATGGITLANANYSRTTFIMPAHAVTVTANFDTIIAQPGTFTDSRDGKTYKTATLGGKTWMAENLSYQIGGSRCFDDDNSNCKKYGRLYDWQTAKTACPAGWRLPNDSEWENLVETAAADGVGKVSCDDMSCEEFWHGAGTKLKAASGWNDNGNGTDDYGFSALPGGRYVCCTGEVGFWWSATPWKNDESCSYRYFGISSKDSNVSRRCGNELDAKYSVRCLKN